MRALTRRAQPPPTRSAAAGNFRDTDMLVHMKAGRGLRCGHRLGDSGACISSDLSAEMFRCQSQADPKKETTCPDNGPRS